MYLLNNQLFTTAEAYKFRRKNLLPFVGIILQPSCTRIVLPLQAENNQKIK
ncbi:hypothetical protein HMPREF1218_0870 [Hoylesella pleuritidis F0068]|uniref:Uncharacterized protein n=1 Tax=Hoylesella pleuritidis F0068 TaxID=1081904 RepID=U2M7X1_9BACT|nr:hypothetical protein HMPREF1218_0870 [Hoylesella pleuritidis F0068]